MHCLYGEEVVALINGAFSIPHSMPDPLACHRTLLVPISVWRCAFLCSVHIILVTVRALSECRIQFVIGLLTQERVLLHYKFSKQNTPPEGEDFCSRDLLQLSAAQPTLLINGPKPLVSAAVLALLRCTARPPGSVGIRGATEELCGAMKHAADVT